MQASDKAQAWKAFWTVLAVAIAAVGVTVSKDTTFQVFVAGVATSIVTAVWVRRPGDSAGGALALCLAFGLAASACAQIKPVADVGCPVIRILDKGCDLLTVELPDGRRMQVSRAELRAAADRTSLARDAGADR